MAAQNKTVTVRFDMVQGTNVESDFGGNARARGGPVKRNKPYLVGEQGPEMFVPYASGYVVPNSATPYVDPGTKVSQSFSVNNPSIIIQSTQGAAIAQQIARQNANVARRARARASLMG
jgi:phage-related minor tail protein